MTQEQKTYTFHVTGMHCQACVLLTESEIADDPRIIQATAALAVRTMTVRGDFGNLAPEKIAHELTARLSRHTLTTEPAAHRVAWREFSVAIPVAFLFLAFFVLLQHVGIVNIITADHATTSVAFAIGIVASLSSCMAVVGGLLLSLSAIVAKEGGRAVRPHVLFHVGRLIAFPVLGAVLGALGSVVAISTVGVLVMSVIVAVVMFFLGLNLLDVLRSAGRFQFTLPPSVTRWITAAAKGRHPSIPLLIGTTTFVLPCGFTQSMQVAALASGNIVTGAVTMGAFALGTFPVLALVSAGAWRFGSDSHLRGTFFKSAGIVVIAFALLTLAGALAAAGVIPPLGTLF